MFALQAS